MVSNTQLDSIAEQIDHARLVVSELENGFYDFARALFDFHASDPSAISMLLEHTDLSRRQLYNLLDVGEFITNHSISKHDAISVGATKLQIIARHVLGRAEVSAKQVSEMMILARATKSRKLARALAGANPRETKAFVFHLDKTETSLLRETLMQFGARRTKNGGLTRKEYALNGLLREAWREME